MCNIENGKIVNSKTEYVCDSPPTIIVNYLENKKKKKKHWTEHFKPIRVGHSPDPNAYYGNYDTNLLEFWDIFKMGLIDDENFYRNYLWYIFDILPTDNNDHQTNLY